MKQKEKPKELIPLDELIAALRIVRRLTAEYNEGREWICHQSGEGFSERRIEQAIEAHGYKKFEGKFYKLSDFQLLSPLEI